MAVTNRHPQIITNQLTTGQTYQPSQLRSRYSITSRIS